jgi:hypothetical protein
MLHYSTIDKSTLELLTRLMASTHFSKMCLCGGTSLALQIGHRKSIDIDLFGQIDLDDITAANTLGSIGTTQTIKKSQNIHIYIVNGIKVDLVNYSYPWIKPIITKDTIRLGSKPDIAAMKLAAVAGRGSKKDFIDIYFLLKEFSLSELLAFYNQKYSDGSSFMVLKSLTYFNDADDDPNPVMLIPTNWEQVKIIIAKEVEAFFSPS